MGQAVEGEGEVSRAVEGEGEGEVSQATEGEREVSQATMWRGGLLLSTSSQFTSFSCPFFYMYEVV